MENDCLSHYGIMGQKWGIRRYQNSDGTLTEDGKRRYAEGWRTGRSRSSDDASVEKILKKSGLGKTNSLTDITKKLADKEAELESINKETEKLMGEYSNNYDTQAYYKAMAGIAHSLINNQTTMDDIAYEIFSFVLDDGDQVPMGSEVVYAYDKDIISKVNELQKRKDQVKKEYKSACEEEVKSLLGEYADEPVSSINDRTVSKDIASHFGESTFNKVFNKSRNKDPGFDLMMATDYYPNDRDKKAIQEAKRMLSKMFDDEDTAWHVSEALEDAGLSDKDFYDMTSRDWEELYDCIARYY